MSPSLPPSPSHSPRDRKRPHPLARRNRPNRGFSNVIRSLSRSTIARRVTRSRWILTVRSSRTILLTSYSRAGDNCEHTDERNAVRNAAGRRKTRLEASSGSDLRLVHQLPHFPHVHHVALSLRDASLAYDRHSRYSLGGIAIGSTSLNVHQMFPEASDTHDGRAERHQAVAMLSLPRFRAPRRGHRCLP